MFADQAVMQLFSTGNISGIVVGLNHQATTITSILEGYWLSQASQYASTAISAAAQAHALRELLPYKFSNTMQSWWYLNTIKNMQLFDVDPRAPKMNLVLPDDQRLQVQEQTLNHITKMYFEPNCYGISELPIPD